MFQEMRRKEKQVTPPEAEAILQKGEYGILSTMGENGYPYGIPVNYAYENGIICFHCAKDTGHKLTNIKNHSQVCFTVVGATEILPAKFSTKYESAIAFGTAREASDKRKSLMLLIEKYSPEFIEPGKKYIESALDKTDVYEIIVEHLTGKRSR